MTAVFDPGYEKAYLAAGWTKRSDGALVPPKKEEPVSLREEIYESFAKEYEKPQTFSLPFNPDDLRQQVMTASYPPDMEKPPQKQTFQTGAQRDTQDGKLRYGLIPYQFTDRLAKVLTDGAIHYGEGNYRLGMPFSRVIDSLLRHVEALRRGDDSEDHLGRAAANLAFLAFYEDQIKKGNLPGDLDDRHRA